MRSKAAFFANRLVLLSGNNGFISLPEITEADALLEKIGNRLPELTTSGDTSTPDDTSHHLSGLLA